MRILIVSEGPHELHGALPELVRKLIDLPLSLENRKVSEPCVRVHLHRGRTAKLTKRALGWMRFAERERYDAIVLVIDEDNDKLRQRDLNTAQEEIRLRLPRAFGVAIRSFDAWILADERALSHVLGGQVDRQSSPETIRDPKSVCRKLRDEHADHLNQREMYRRVAEQTHLDLLAERCPRGFAPFAKRVRALGPSA